MPSRVTTPATLEFPGHRPGLLELRLLERRLADRLSALDARVETLLANPSSYSDREVADVDVLCAVIAEVTELRDVARADVLRERAARRARRSGARRWG